MAFSHASIYKQMNCIKKSLPVLTLVFLIAYSCATYGAVTLADAIKNKWVTATIRGFDYRQDSVYRSAFYGRCLVLTCKNLRATPIEITEAAGRFFIPDDTAIQRMILTDAIAFTLGAQKESSFPMYAMCTEAQDGAPGAGSFFKPGTMAPQQLAPLIRYIDDNNYQNDAAQQAIWCMTNDYSPYQISSDDTLVSNKLRKKVCELKNVPFVRDAGQQHFPSLPLFRIVDGSFTYIIQKTKLVDLIIFNEAGQEVKKLVTNTTQPAGSYTYDYHFNFPINENALLRQALVIKFYLNGELIAEKKHVLGQSN